MKLYYDLHIHSALSPCGDNDMTPNNIVNMSIIKGLDVIAVTDHNSCGNVEAVMKVADGKILVIPGMEIETAEEIHVVSYFPDLDRAKAAGSLIRSHMSGIKNRPEIFGNQYFMDEEDEIVGEEENLLVSATTLDIFDTFRLVRECGGVALPAHIDRSSYSVISSLGDIPPELPVTSLEITPGNREEWSKKYIKYNILSNSDAHYLENISEPYFYMDTMNKNIDEIFRYLCNKE